MLLVDVGWRRGDAVCTRFVLARRCGWIRTLRTASADGSLTVSTCVRSLERGGDPAINRCRRAPDRTARRGHVAFAGWCPSVARCCSLRSELRSRGASPMVPCAITRSGAHFDLQEHAAPISGPRSAPQPGPGWCCWCRVVVYVVVTAVVSLPLGTGPALRHPLPRPDSSMWLPGQR